MMEFKLTYVVSAKGGMISYLGQNYYSIKK